MSAAGVHVRPLEPGDWAGWLRMRTALWPEQAEAHEAEMRAWLARADATVIVAVRSDGGLGGFAEAGERPYADGCETSPVAFLEGWYVDPDLRGRGVGRALVAAVERWAVARGRRELASDALLENEVSHRAHEAVGFAEVERAVRYRKALPPPADVPGSAPAPDGG